MPPVEREPGIAERSGELVELGKSDTETIETIATFAMVSCALATSDEDSSADAWIAMRRTYVQSSQDVPAPIRVVLGTL